MIDEDAKELLHQHWVHSHEEDTETEQVFRPADYSFPPSRGRTGFKLNPDGTLVETKPGPTDRPQAQLGQWELQEDDSLILHPGAPSGSISSMRIASVEKDRLVVKKKVACDTE